MSVTFIRVGPRGVFYTCFYNHAHRLRLEKLLYLELSRSSNGFFKCFWIQVAVSEVKRPLRNRSEVKRLQIYSGYMQRPFPNGKKCPFGYNSYVTAVAAGQSQRFYSGVQDGNFGRLHPQVSCEI
jgi:hypothetical protein